MKPSDHAPGSVENAAYSQADWDEVSNNPDLTTEQLAQMRLGPEGLPPDLAAALDQRSHGPAKAQGVPVSLSVDPDVLAAYKAAGPGWQARMNRPWPRGSRAASGAPRPASAADRPAVDSHGRAMVGAASPKDAR